MKSIQEIALEVAVDYLKFKLGDRKGFNIYDIDASDADELIAEIEKECVVSFMEFLARVDQERGRDAFCYLYRDMNSGGKNGALKVCSITPCDEAFPVFLSPTIPAGYALVPIEPTEAMLEALRAPFGTETVRGGGYYGLSPIKHTYSDKYKAMIQAAQEGVTK